jgi:hypothetical protein
MPNQAYNPIQSVGGTVVPVPSKYDWKLSDVSAADAGRTEDALMHKMRIAQKVHIELEWQNVSDVDARTILTAFNPEYINVNYYDFKAMSFQTKRFYVGDRSVSAYNRTAGMEYSTISFNIIER